MEQRRKQEYSVPKKEPLQKSHTPPVNVLLFNSHVVLLLQGNLANNF